MAKSGLVETHNLFALLNACFNFGNMARGIIINQLVNFMFAQHREVLLGRKLALAKALACNALGHGGDAGWV